MRLRFLALLMAFVGGLMPSHAAETTPLTEFTKRGTGGSVAISLEQSDAGTFLVSEFTITNPGVTWHFYSTDLPETGGADGTGRPAKIAIPEGSPLIALGPRSANVAVIEKAVGGGGPSAVYPPGPVTIRQPVQLPAGDGSPIAVELKVWYMICDERSCLRPVQGTAITVEVPTVVSADGQSNAAESTQVENDAESALEPEAQVVNPQPAAVTVTVWPWWLGLLVAIPAFALAFLKFSWPLGLVQRVSPWRLLFSVALVTVGLMAITRPVADYERAEGIAWQHVQSVADVRAAVATAHADGRAALLDFTGPACANCQEMAKNIFIIDEVREAWSSGLPIEVDTDTHPELEEWQGEAFGTWNRPLYVRIEPGVAEADWAESMRWDARVTRGDEAGITALVNFLEGEQQQAMSIDQSTGGWTGFVLLALAGGLFTLVMPCTYPMIPFTVTFFSKQAAAGRSLPPLAACYALGIVGFFALLGLLVGAVFGAGLTSFAGSPIVNLVIGLLFVVFGLSLLGLFLLRLPAGLESAVGGGRGGYLGALVMGLTFAITAFTCTAPFAGLVLGEAASDAATTGTWVRAVVGMVLYSSVIAVPFFFLSISPGLLNRLPRAGAWMSEFKVVGGLVEIGAALKFLAIVDVRWDWGVITRTPTLAIWSALAVLCAVYILGLVRMKDDSPVQRPGLMRYALSVAFTFIAVWLAGGLTGDHLGIIESFFPADVAPLLR